MNKLYWLIEAPNPKGPGEPRGYLKDIDRDGTYDVYMTTDPNKAMRFPDRFSAQSIIDDTGFIHAMGTGKGFMVAEHMDMDGPPPEGSE